MAATADEVDEVFVRCFEVDFLPVGGLVEGDYGAEDAPGQL